MAILDVEFGVDEKPLNVWCKSLTLSVNFLNYVLDFLDMGILNPENKQKNTQDICKVSHRLLALHYVNIYEFFPSTVIECEAFNDF